MPIHRGKDIGGYYFQWGEHGKKYYYRTTDRYDRLSAYKKAVKQMRAIYKSGYRGH